MKLRHGYRRRLAGLLLIGTFGMAGLQIAGPAGPRLEAAGDGFRVFLPLGLQGSVLAGNAVAVAPPVPTTAPSRVPPTAAPTDMPPPTLPASPTAPARPTTPPAPTAAAGSGDCPRDTFLIPKADPHNAKYPAPTLNVSCVGTNLVVESNGIPSFEFRAMTPNELQAVTNRWQIPLTPTLAMSETQVPLLGPVGIIVDGLPIYGPNEAPQQGTGDPYLDGILDFCDGHTGPRGDYHYHARPDCLFKAEARALVGRVVGYAFDGITILAPYVCADKECTEIKKLTSSWQKTSEARNAWDSHGYVAGSGDLDRCNGRVGADGKYHYYATDTFPYLLACYKGVPTRNGAGGGGPGGGGGQPGPGPRPTRQP